MSASNYVFVLDTNRKPLAPCRPITARKLLKAGKAAVFRRYPFSIILNKSVAADPPALQVKLDPGSKVTGIAVKQGSKIVFGAEIQHRGQQIKSNLDSRRAARRSRRQRKTRYRAPRFLNRTRSEGWLPPSLRHRVETTLTWVRRVGKLAPITSMAMELVRFDTQLMQNPEVSGVEYQQGELAGYEVREYLLEKWGRHCVYCGANDTPLEVEHIVPRSKGGSNRVSNLTLACHPCNQAKGNRDIEDFLSGKSELLSRILKQSQQPLKDAAAVNSTRWSLFNALKGSGLPITVGTGGRTKYNRVKLGIPKAHWLDAACVGDTPELELGTERPLQIKSRGHGKRFRTLVDKYGFPKAVMKVPKRINGIGAGDIVKAIVPNGKYAGEWLGTIAGIRGHGRAPALRPSGGKQIDLTTKTTIQPIHRSDGYEYAS